MVEAARVEAVRMAWSSVGTIGKGAGYGFPGAINVMLTSTESSGSGTVVATIPLWVMFTLKENEDLCQVRVSPLVNRFYFKGLYTGLMRMAYARLSPRTFCYGAPFYIIGGTKIELTKANYQNTDITVNVDGTTVMNRNISVGNSLMLSLQLDNQFNLLQTIIEPVESTTMALNAEIQGSGLHTIEVQAILTNIVWSGTCTASTLSFH